MSSGARRRKKYMAHQYKVGDVVGFIFAMPGPDVTFLVIDTVREDDVDAHDLFFGHDLKSISKSKIWPASEEELDSGIDLPGEDGKQHSYTVRGLAEAYRKESEG